MHTENKVCNNCLINFLFICYKMTVSWVVWEGTPLMNMLPSMAPMPGGVNSSLAGPVGRLVSKFGLGKWRCGRGSKWRSSTCFFFFARWFFYGFDLPWDGFITMKIHHHFGRNIFGWILFQPTNKNKQIWVSCFCSIMGNIIPPTDKNHLTWSNLGICWGKQI